VKYVDEYRDPEAAHKLVAEIRASATAPRQIMEVCGGQTHTLIRYGIDELLAGSVELRREMADDPAADVDRHATEEPLRCDRRPDRACIAEDVRRVAVAIDRTHELDQVVGLIRAQQPIGQFGHRGCRPRPDEPHMLT